MKNIKVKMTIYLSLIVTGLLLGTTGLWFSNIRTTVDNSFLLNGNEKVTIGYGQQYNDQGYLINFDGTTNKDIVVDNNVNTQEVGEYTVTYTLRYMNYNKSLTRKVKVVDNKAPELIIECDNEIYIEKNNKFEVCKHTASDNYDKAEKIKVKVTNNVNTSKIGDYTINYKAIDTSGNTTEKQIKVHVRNAEELNYIKISIKKQTLEYYEDGKLYLSTPITSGKYNGTPKGKYKILNKTRNTSLRGRDYVSFVKYWMAFKGNKYGIHDASWRNNFGNMNYYYNGSHGCVNTPTKAMEKLFARVKVGTTVYITE